MIISPYIMNYGVSSYDLRKVAMYSDSDDAAGFVNVRFTNINDTTIRLPKTEFEAQYQQSLTASLTTQNLFVDAAGYTYYGAQGVVGTWRVGRSGNNIVWQRLDAIGPETWVTKNTITG